MAQQIFVFLTRRKKLDVFFLMFALVSCTSVSTETVSNVSASQFIEPSPSSYGCPITPVQTDFWGNMAVSGEFPIWITSRGRYLWSEVGPKIYPPSSTASSFVYGYGHTTKNLIFIDSTLKGDLTITGRRLDEEGTVYFPKSTEYNELAGSTERKLKVVPSEATTISDAHEPSNLPNPPGKVHHGFSPLYPNPGCYELTATIEAYKVSIVIEITDS